MPLWLNTRASSIVSAVPLPSSLTPGAKLSSGALGSAGGGSAASGSARGSGGVGRALAAWTRQRVVVAADVDRAAGSGPGRIAMTLRSSTSRVMRPCFGT